ncbi:MAG: hypothetical protein QOF16_1149 [Actinomycetota bacterium]|jgi:hypothetical protein|nr:hypothetical protein [Actinomycetota bacterium]
MKRALSIAVAVSALIAATGAFPIHASAAKATTVVKDPAGDANGVNDQGASDGSVGDQNAAGVSTVGDLDSVSLSNDAKNLYVTFLTEAPPPATEGVGYRVRFNPTATAGTQCINIEAFFPGAGNDLTDFQAQLRDSCGGTTVTTPLKILGEVITVPRKLDKAFAAGAKLTAPQAQSFVCVGSGAAALGTYPVLDTTKVGTDYTFTK